MSGAKELPRHLLQELWRPLDVLAHHLHLGARVVREAEGFVLRGAAGEVVAVASDLAALAEQLDRPRARYSVRLKLSDRTLSAIRKVRTRRESHTDFVRSALQHEIARRRAALQAEDEAWFNSDEEAVPCSTVHVYCGPAKQA